MENSRSKQFISFKLCMILSRIMKSFAFSHYHSGFCICSKSSDLYPYETRTERQTEKGKGHAKMESETEIKLS
jgi:hypothetical protein